MKTRVSLKYFVTDCSQQISVSEGVKQFISDSGDLVLNFLYLGACSDFFGEWLLFLRLVLIYRYQFSHHVSLKAYTSLY